MNHQQHVFALFSTAFSKSVFDRQKIFTESESTVVHRLQHVLRLDVGQQVICFDNAVHAVCTVQSYTKGRAVLAYETVQKNVPVVPELTVVLPLLKREALDEVVYACRELGVTRVQLVATQKSSRQSVQASELERLERVSIAAAEQSKNFAACTIMTGPNGVAPTLSAWLQEHALTGSYENAYKLVAQVGGAHLQAVLPQLADIQKPCVVTVGPEGDFTQEERDALQNSGFVPVQLGTTILRAQQAAVLMVGLVRALR